MNPSLSDIKAATVAYYKDNRITRADLEARPKFYRISHPRQVAMYLARALTNHSYPRIAQSFGGRHHTTVMHAVWSVEKDRERLADAENIRKALEARTSPWKAFPEELAAAKAVGEFVSLLRLVEAGEDSLTILREHTWATPA